MSRGCERGSARAGRRPTARARSGGARQRRTPRMLIPRCLPPQILGEVVNDTTIREARHCKLGDEFDLDVYGAFCKISTGSMKQLFVKD